MVRNVVGAKQNIEPRSRVKTGCITCRIRKIKCDEGKPSCHKCVSTGRTCDGYESPFKLIQNVRPDSEKLEIASQQIQSSLDGIALEDVELLNRCLSTKTIFDGVELDCNEEARQVLQASLTTPSVRHAVLSLKALRNDFETTQNGLPFVVEQDPSYAYGTQQYSMALKGLSFNLASLGFKVVRSALLCCQIFISIEQVQGNYSAMIQHVIGGLKIMHEYRRMQPAAKGGSELEEDEQLPLLDLFIIKLFAVPCKFEEPPIKNQEHEIPTSTYPVMAHQESIRRRHLLILRPNMRTELIKIATLTMKFLSKASKVEPTANISLLLSEKAELLDSLELWHTSFESVLEKPERPDSELVSTSFMRLFHMLLKIVLLEALDFSADLHVKLQSENDRLQSIADLISERIKSYRT